MAQSLDALISAEQLALQLAQPNPPVVLDCRFSLQDAQAGRNAYLQQHIPSAQYADLDQQLSDPVQKGVTGRHPLPSEQRLLAAMQTWGINTEQAVVVYDQNNGAMAAARAWWLLRYAGVQQVQVLNGGLDAWIAAGQLCNTGEEAAKVTIDHANIKPSWQTDWLYDAQQIIQQQPNLLDARGIERFAGEVEPIDPIAGHIPNAQCLPFTQLVDVTGRFLPKTELKTQLEAQALDSSKPLVAYCGSGVTACHLILAYVIAGLPEPKLYAGSWSEWITDTTRPVATGR
ncbi:thiosulfate/3-mercaptopyruvate sulfurtransferase [Oceanospirillum multiglobuliferum]|uniref:Rhodanese domain-containing protein n=1 Tax=Oceanospirillum multiglobuliferum TaxID=64969 RepID=A0A1T4SKM1_9GAMM|nr:sulfurtransferase [Oceanospirillum multiglobuliferum]OPX54210.1 hypothetical protein BTE48_15370 [Oceanospirillum multiglobuliferum]SKA28468.1 thiosulfate/3-mercaptopyruvate sulfurtransferase [Oceanospirillum multiglobuliferum]